jgi:hypothetical protein
MWFFLIGYGGVARSIVDSTVGEVSHKIQEAAGNIDITKKIEYLIPTTCLSDVRVFEAKS